MKNPRDYLIKRGWWYHAGLWHNLALSFGWPMKDAIRLEQEAGSETDGDRARKILRVVA